MIEHYAVKRLTEEDIKYDLLILKKAAKDAFFESEMAAISEDDPNHLEVMIDCHERGRAFERAVEAYQKVAAREIFTDTVLVDSAE